MFYLDLIMPICFGVAYYRLGEIEYKRGALISSLSVLLWLATRFGLGWGWGGSILAQFGIFVGLTVFNVYRGVKH
jgi:hypothetical protein